MNPAMLRRQRKERFLDASAKLRIDVDRVRRLMQRAQIRRARSEVVAIGAGGGDGDGDLQRHLYLVAVRV